MNVWQPCSDVRDAVSFYKPCGLYLKPSACIHISVQLPQLKPHGKALSNWEIMEKLKCWIQPVQFTSLKVSKSTLEFIRLDGEIENKLKLTSVLARLDGKAIKVSGFSEQLKIRAVEAKSDFPNKHDWDSFFRDSKDMNEMKAGERPDTIYLGNLPCKWFLSEPSDAKPSDKLFRKIFEQFGEVVRVDIPMLDPFRNQMNSHISGVKQFTFNQNVIFEAYVQFKEYFCFVKAMDAFRGTKLVYMDKDKNAFTASIKVDFDKSKHLSDASVRRREIVRERLERKEKEKVEKEMKEKEEEEKRKQAEMKQKLERRKQREEKRKQKQIEKLKLKEVDDINEKIATEEYLLLMAQRKLESIRLLGELINRVKNEKEKELSMSNNKERKKHKHKNEKNSEKEPVSKKVKSSEIETDAEKDLRYKLIRKFKKMQERQLAKEKIKLKSQVPEASELLKSTTNVSSISTGSSSENDNSARTKFDNRNNYESSYNPPTSNRRFGRPFQRNARSRGSYPANSSRPYQNQNYRGGGRFARGRSGGGGGCGGRYNSWKGLYQGQYMMPFMDPMLLSYSHKYYKYLQRLARDSQRSRRNSSASSRSYSRSTKSYSRSRSRSRSRSYTRSYSRSYSRSRSRSYSRSSRRWSSRSRSPRRPPPQPKTADDTKTTPVDGRGEDATTKESTSATTQNVDESSIKKHKEKKKKHKKKKKKHKSEKKDEETAVA